MGAGAKKIAHFGGNRRGGRKEWAVGNASLRVALKETPLGTCPPGLPCTR